MTKNPFPRRIANLFGVFGYLSLSMQWLWLAATLVLPHLSTDSFRNIFVPQSSPIEYSPPVIDAIPPFVETLILIISIVFAVVVIIYAILTVPKSIGRAGQKLTKSTTEFTLSQVSRQQPIAPKKRQALTWRLSWLVKLLLVATPLLLLTLPISDDIGLNRDHVIILGGFFGVVSLINFLLQFIISRLAKLNYREIW